MNGERLTERELELLGELQRLERNEQVHAEVINQYVQRAEAAESEVARLKAVARAKRSRK
jgi:hypothetical protein